jgi:hypothetical protein
MSLFNVCIYIVKLLFGFVSGKKGESSTTTGVDTNYQINETVEPNYYSSSIYYGGQENYTNSPRTCRTTQPPHFVSPLPSYVVAIAVIL